MGYYAKKDNWNSYVPRTGLTESASQTAYINVSGNWGGVSKLPKRASRFIRKILPQVSGNNVQPILGACTPDLLQVIYLPAHRTLCTFMVGSKRFGGVLLTFH